MVLISKSIVMTKSVSYVTLSDNLHTNMASNKIILKTTLMTSIVTLQVLVIVTNNYVDVELIELIMIDLNTYFNGILL